MLEPLLAKSEKFEIRVREVAYNLSQAFFSPIQAEIVTSLHANMFRKHPFVWQKKPSRKSGSKGGFADTVLWHKE